MSIILENSYSLEFNYQQDKAADDKIKLVYRIPSYLITSVQYSESYHLFTSVIDKEVMLMTPGTNSYYQATTTGVLINNLKNLQSYQTWYDHLKKLWAWNDEYLWEDIYTKDAYINSSSPKLPPISTPSKYWHAYYISKESLFNAPDRVPISNKKLTLWYSGFKDILWDII